MDNITDAVGVLRAERSENVQRKDMLPSELASLGAALEELERPKAAKRQAEHGGTAPGRRARNTSGTGTGSVSETAMNVADALGVSTSTYKRARAVRRATTDESLPEPERERAQKALDEMDRTNTVTPVHRQWKSGATFDAPNPAPPAQANGGKRVRNRRPLTESFDRAAGDLVSADVLRAEADENTERKGLTPYEASRARERRARVLAEDAEKRAEAGRERGRAVQHGVLVSPKLGETSTPESAVRKSRETAKAAALGTGYSGSTLDKVDQIRSAAERGVVKQDGTEIPVPDPVREVAREQLENVKQTGAAVDRAHRAVVTAIDTYIDENPDRRRADPRPMFAASYVCNTEINFSISAGRGTHRRVPIGGTRTDVPPASRSARYRSTCAGSTHPVSAPASAHSMRIDGRIRPPCKP